MTGLSSFSSPARFLAEVKLLDVHEHGSWWWRTLLSPISLKKLNSFAKPKLILVVVAAPYFPSVNTLLLLLLRDRFTSSRAGRAAREEWTLLLTHDSTTNFFKQFLISSKNLLPNSITFFFDDCTESLCLSRFPRYLTDYRSRSRTNCTRRTTLLIIIIIIIIMDGAMGSKLHTMTLKSVLQRRS